MSYIMAIEVVNAENFADYVARNSVDPNEPVKITVGADSTSTVVDPGNGKTGNAAPAAEGADKSAEGKAKGGAFQERIDELTRLRREADEFAEGEYNARLRADERINQLQAELDELRKAAPTQADDEKGKPDPKNYKDGEEQKYIDDLAKWHSERAVAKDRKEQEALRTKAAQEAEFAAMVDAYNARTAEYKKEHPEFQAAIDSVADQPIRPWIRDTIMESEHGPALALYMAQNPSFRVDLNKMKANMACRELGRLEARLTSEPKKLDSQREQTNRTDATTTRTRLPPPITPVTGGEATIERDPRQPMPYQEYKRLRRAGKIT